jgi:hypothetical protein
MIGGKMEESTWKVHISEKNVLYFLALFNDCVATGQIMLYRMRRKYKVMTNIHCAEMAEGQA